MKVLGIACSGRKKGNSEILVQTALDKAQEEGADVELVTLAGKTISPCDGCLSCRKTGRCHIEDDMQDILTKLLEADGIVFGTPVYFWSLSAQAKILIDRTYVFSQGRKLRNKAAGVLVSERRSGASRAVAEFNAFFTIQKMMMVGWGVGPNVPEHNKRGSIKKQEEVMDEAEALGKAIVQYIQTREIPAHKEKGWEVDAE